MRITQYANYPICQLPNMPITQYAHYPICQLPNIPITQYANYPIYQLPNIQHSRLFSKKLPWRRMKDFPSKTLHLFTQVHIVSHHILFSYFFFKPLIVCSRKGTSIRSHFFSNYVTTDIPPFHSVLQAVSVRLRSSHKPISVPWRL